MNQDIMKSLGEPFSFEEIEAKIQVTSKDKSTGLAVFYLDSRAIQKRLDEVVGPLNWSNDYSPWQDKAQICGISIYNEERKEWVTKHDGADNSAIEAIKGGLTDAFKRAAVLWGIGRYLYQIDGVWVEIEQRGNSSVIKENQKSKLKVAYETAVKKIFVTEINQQGSGGRVNSNGNANGNASRANSSNKQQPSNNQPSQQQSAPSVPQNVNSGQPQTPQTSNSEQKTDSGQKPPTLAPQPPATVHPSNVFKIQSMKPSGKTSQLLELCDGSGKITSAFIKSDAQGIAVGAYLYNVQIKEKVGTYGKYNLIGNYELAA